MTLGYFVINLCATLCSSFLYTINTKVYQKVTQLSQRNIIRLNICAYFIISDSGKSYSSIILIFISSSDSKIGL